MSALNLDLVLPTSQRPNTFGAGILKTFKIFTSLEFLILCVLFGFPIDALPVIGAYSFWTNIFFGLAATGAAVLEYNRLGWKLPRLSGSIIVLHLVFCAYLTINLLQTDNPFHFGIRKTFLVLVGGCWALFAASAIAARPDGPARFVKALLTYGLFFALSNNLSLFGSGELARAAFTENYQHASRAAGLGVIGCLAYLTHPGIGGKGKVGILGLLFVCMFAQLVSGGRTGLGASLICVFVFLLLNVSFSSFQIRIKKRFFIFAAIAFAGLILLVYLIANGWRPATINRFLIIFEGASELNVSFNNRVGRYQKFDELFGQAPIFGHGTGSWDEVSGEVESYYPHNLIMELLVEQGMVGASLLLGSLTVLVARFLKYTDVKENYTMQAIILYAVYVVTTTMFTGDLGLNMYLYSVMALLAARQIKTISPAQVQHIKTARHKS